MTDPLTRFLADQRAIAEAATPGPWQACTWDPMVGNHVFVAGKHNDMHSPDIPHKRADAEYVANWSPDRARKVLDVVEAAQAIFDEGYDETTIGWLGGENPNMAKVPARLLDKLRAALLAVAAKEPRP